MLEFIKKTGVLRQRVSVLSIGIVLVVCAVSYVILHISSNYFRIESGSLGSVHSCMKRFDHDLMSETSIKEICVRKNERVIELEEILRWDSRGRPIEPSAKINPYRFHSTIRIDIGNDYENRVLTRQVLTAVIYDSWGNEQKYKLEKRVWVEPFQKATYILIDRKITDLMIEYPDECFEKYKGRTDNRGHYPPFIECNYFLTGGTYYINTNDDK